MHTFLHALSVFGILTAASAGSPHDPPRPDAPAPNDMLARGRHGCVVAAEPRAARAGLDVLKAGGNAVDAAVATALALSVTHPQAGNLGGGGFLIVRMADGRTAAFDFREMAPAAAHRDMYLTEDGSVHPDKSLWGALAGGVPGSPAGLELARERFGSKPLAELAARAIELARDGFEVDHFLAGSLASKDGILGRFESTRNVFYRDGRPLRAGEMLVQTDLADTLGRFAAEGFDGFYRGETARRFAAHQAATGGLITADDLARYEVKVRDVLRGTYRGHEILAMPPASSGGVALLQMLAMIEPFEIGESGWGSVRTLHLMTEVMRRAYADRARWLGDSDQWPVPLAGLLDPEYLGHRRATIRLDRVSNVDMGLPPGAPEGEDTTHFSVVDAAGNAVSCTTTINSTFGSGLVIGGCGFFLNNEMDDFSAKPGVPNQFGLIGYEANAIQPGKRPLSSMTPILVVKDEAVRYVLGSPGGGRIINTVFQVFLNLAEHDLPLRDAVTAPRIHHQWKPDVLYWERLAINPNVESVLERMGHVLANRPRGIGRCQAIEIQPDGTRVGAADPRSGGAAVAW